MKYESTRGSKTLQSSTGAIIRGIAEDRGLYVPVSVPKLPLSVAAMKGMTYQQIAFHVIGAFFDEYTEDELRDIVARAYDSKFEAPQVVPLVKAGKAWFLELYQGSHHRYAVACLRDLLFPADHRLQLLLFDDPVQPD